MNKKKVMILVLTLLFGGTTVATDDAEKLISHLTQNASEAYSESNWAVAIENFTKLLKIQSNNEQAWYRLSQSHLNLKQGELAFKANAQLSSAAQIPISMVHYQKAQALNLMGQIDEVWSSLELAATAGYRNMDDLENNAMWSDLKNKKQFVEVKKKVDKNIRPCMYDERYRQFDFWLGHWVVYGNLEKTGPMFGHNSIERTEQGCLIMEQWQGARGSTGTSMNYFDGIKNQWVQRWVSGGGTVIDYSGGLINHEDKSKSMQLIGKIYYAAAQQQPQIRNFRGTWTPLKDGVVRQFFEESVDAGATWYTWFDGYYFPIKEELTHE